SLCVPVFSLFYIFVSAVPLLSFIGPILAAPYVVAVLTQFRRIRRVGRRYSTIRYTTVDAQQRLLMDRRPPVLYLRSFLGEMLDDPTRINLLTDEELICQVFKQIGPVIAIGRPGEHLPPIGASRFYYSDDEWQDEVKKLMKGAQVIVVKPGISQ